jgi:hypothetical protein
MTRPMNIVQLKEQNKQSEKDIRKDEKNKMLEIVNWHIATAKQEYERGCDRDAGKWTGCNCTDYPHGKLDALEKLKKEMIGKAKK